MRDIAIPNGLGAVGYDEGDVDDLVEGTLKQQRLLATAPRDVTEDDAGGDPPPVARAVVTLTRPLRSTGSLALRRRGSPTSTTRRWPGRSTPATPRSTGSPPQVVVRPRHTDEIAATLAVARETGAPLTMRGAGTSIAGNAVGAGHRRRHQPAPQPGAAIDPRGAHGAGAARRRARRAADAGRAARPAVRPRPVDAHPLHDRRDDRQQRLRLAGARLRPHGRQRRGADRAAGRRRSCGCGWPATSARPTDALDALVDEHLGTVRTEFGRFGRQVSRLLLRAPAPRARPTVRPVPGRHRGHARRSSSTRPCGWSRTPRPGRSRCWATRRWPRRRTPYPPCWQHPPGRAARGSTSASPAWCQRRVPSCPRGGGWLFAEVTGATPRRPRRGAGGRRGAGVAAPDRHRRRRAARAVADPRGRRRPGRALAAAARRTPGWEDAAVPPATARRLPARLRRAAQASTRSTACPTATSATAACTCGSTSSSRTPAVAAGSASSSSDAADLVASYGGSMSGEHGDGRARSRAAAADVLRRRRSR